jgi:uncharacterized protein YndB with AHSA1/START domain
MASIRLSKVIERPPADVFRFVATDHVKNHPRWSPDVSLEQMTPGPIGVGTVIRRNYMDAGTPVEGVMEVTEYEPDRVVSVVIRDGPAELRSRMTVEPEGERSSLLTVLVAADDPAARMNESWIRQSLDRMKELIEGEA